MRTLALLAAILLVTLQAQAELHSGMADDGVDQQQPRAQDLDVAVYIKQDETSPLEVLGAKAGVSCTCRRFSCGFGERASGSCTVNGVRHTLCCRR
ncbi:neutrophil antibiotic peptide NP-4 precursor [Oryctolagus cuniculus]|uniref:Neutrophil antibiotic peptide NP-4 n=2 Tax=Oryctolagus cuniculus TaxID=9986 RepID=DEF5_RABIT|nr:neutrophil antibiotic peptide NP-4 precursor [Oryctolagus cuniculus]P07467.2 RecName: Full=Neutrophil antibiotic peptide NP-4; AltName: Full=Microbicidal peptide NP-4; Flags: Precursor [Oryctolagus cuniculus]AAA31238.1 defensin NP-4 [Oryctolagus cuniculus]prf//1904312B prepro-defensin NP-4 [Oryctolagus cuniculus]